MKEYNYVITSGWWCEETDNHENRDVFYGDKDIRKSNFHHKWYEAIKLFTRPEKILIVDSNSPVPPPYNKNDDRIEYVKLAKNTGHSTRHSGKFCGFTQGYITGLCYAIANEFDYWVYIEQDALIYGEDIIENCIESMTGPYMFGSGRNTWAPVQQSLMIIRKDGFLPYLDRLLAIKAADCEIIPEMKTVLASSKILSRLPEVIFRRYTNSEFINDYRKRLVRKLISLFSGFDDVPFGFGVARPIDFSSENFYFQHGSKAELKSFEDKIKSHLSNQPPQKITEPRHTLPDKDAERSKAN